MNTTKQIYEYQDYREYLRDFYETLKKQDKKFSQRYLALKLGVKSSGFLSEVINGKRNLSQNNVLQWLKVLKLDKDASCYFDNLVHFNQAVSLSEKSYWLQKLMDCKKVHLSVLNKDLYEYFSRWYYTAIREMFFYYHNPADPKQIAAQVYPPIKADDAKNAISLLERLGMIEKQPDGSYKQRNAMVSTGDTVKSIEVANFQQQTAELAKEAILNVPSTLRDITTLTVSISEAGYSRICELLKETRKEIAKIAQNDSGEDRVYQVNVQLFPLTKTK